MEGISPEDGRGNQEGRGVGVGGAGRWVIFIGERKAEQAAPLTGAARNNNVVLSWGRYLASLIRSRARKTHFGLILFPVKSSPP